MDTTQMLTARPEKLSDGSWGVAFEGEAQAGDRVIVVSQRGKEWTSILDEVVKPGIWRVLPIDHTIAKATQTQLDTIMRMLDSELKGVKSFETVAGNGYELTMKLLSRRTFSDLTMDEAHRLIAEINDYLKQRTDKQKGRRGADKASKDG